MGIAVLGSKPQQALAGIEDFPFLLRKPDHRERIKKTGGLDSERGAWIALSNDHPRRNDGARPASPGGLFFISRASSSNCGTGVGSLRDPTPDLRESAPRSQVTALDERLVAGSRMRSSGLFMQKAEGNEHNENDSTFKAMVAMIALTTPVSPAF